MDLGAYEVQPAGPTYGDMDCDGDVDADDVAPFVLALVDPAAFATQYANCDIDNADCNMDAAVDGLDIQLIVQELLKELGMDPACVELHKMAPNMPQDLLAWLGAKI